MKTIGSGFYFHFGIKKFIKTIQNGYKVQNNKVSISVNIDGLRLFKSSKKQPWPILGLINDLPNSVSFTIGVFCGDSKPDSVGKFLDDFVAELKSLYQNGVHVSKKTLYSNLNALYVMHLKQAKGHNAHHGSERCTQRGVWLNKVTFPGCSAPLRTDEEFAVKQDIDHHGPTESPFKNCQLLWCHNLF